MEARCQCGRNRFTTPTPEPIKLFICHCDECKRSSGSAFGITALFPHFDFPTSAEQQSEISTYTRTSERGTVVEGFFCRHCGSRLVERAAGDNDTTLVKGGALVGITKEMMSNVAHLYCRQAIVDVPAGVERYEGWLFD